MFAYVEDKKILQYLLAVGDDITSDAAGKSKFFHQIGFTRANFHLLADALVVHSQTAQHIFTKETEYGLRYGFQCEMPEAPNGRRYCIKSVWLAEPEGLRLITAMPAHPV